MSECKHSFVIAACYDKGKYFEQCTICKFWNITNENNHCGIVGLPIPAKLMVNLDGLEIKKE
jgi:hypothetical protein